MKTPTATQIRAARERLGLSRAEAAALVHRSARAWEKFEQGRPIDQALWELWLLKAKGSSHAFAADKMLRPLAAIALRADR